MIRPNGTPVDPANTMEYQQVARTIYGGCIVNAAVRPWLQDNNHGRAVRCDLIAVQFAADGEAFGEGEIDASGMFGQVDVAPAVIAPGVQQTVPTPPQFNQQVPGVPGAQPPTVPGMPDFMK